ncbi:fimbrial protein [Pseudomonas sp. PHC1]|uniref:fimbrial protein n=1 Tax=Pseudomonas sp. PHC1 TaxID=3384759 RepID=UPI00396F4174
MKKIMTSLIFTLTSYEVQAALPDLNSAGNQNLILPVDTRCALSSGSNVVEYTSQSRWQLQDASTGGNQLTFGKRTLILSVACPYSQKIRLALRGDRAADGNLRFGNQGIMLVRIHDAQLDGQSVQVVSTSSEGTINDSPSDSKLILPGQIFTPSTNGHSMNGKTFTVRVDVEPLLPEKEARVSAHQKSEALMTIDLVNQP